MRFALGLLMCVGSLANAVAQSAGTSSAAPPAREALERLNLKTDWVSYLPLSGPSDGIALIQTIDTNQMIVQTKSGQVIAVDAVTGARQWSYRLPSQFVNIYPVSVNERFVFVVNVARLLCFHRYTGLLEFNFELPGSATSGPVSDQELVYVILNGRKLNAYRFPDRLVAEDRATQEAAGKPIKNIADTVATRYGNRSSLVGIRNEPFTKLNYSLDPRSDAGLGPNQLSPSISALPSISPPYTLNNRGLYITPSIDVVPSLRQPYQLRPDFMRYNQRTPSLSAQQRIAGVDELASFKPRGVNPELAWSYLANAHLVNEPVLTDLAAISEMKNVESTTRIWITSDTNVIEAIDKRKGKVNITSRVQDNIASPMTGPAKLGDKKFGFLGLKDGTILAFELLEGTEDYARIEWRANIGGFMNHPVLITKDGVFASGEQAGIARIDFDGEVAWKSDRGADRILAVNDEFVYAKNRQGKLAVYDRYRPTDAATGNSRPLTTLDVSRFNIAPTNTVSDRIILAADSGIIISLRDRSPKYLAPVPLIPPPAKPKPAEQDRAAEPNANPDL